MADRYGRAGGNWSASGTWSASSGGGSDGAGINAGDAVILDANSSGNFVIDTSISIVSIVCTGFTGTLTHNGVTLTISGNTFTFVSGMTYTAVASSRVITFSSTSGTTLITTGGKTLPTVNFNGAGGTFQFQDAFTARPDCTVTLTSGTLDANNQDSSMGAFIANGSTTRVVTPGSGTWTLTSTGVNPTIIWDLNGTNLTLNTGSWTLVASSTNAGERTLVFGTSKTYNNITITSAGSAVGSADTRLGAGTGVTIGTLTVTTPNMINFYQGAIFTITTLNSVGTAYNNSNALFCSASGQNIPTIAVTTANIEWNAIFGLTFTGSPTATNSFDCGRNSGITISGPSGGGVVGVIGS